MKGYTEVTVEKALLALKTRNDRKDVAVAIRKEAIERYAIDWNNKASSYRKWKKRKCTTAEQLLYSNYDWWCDTAPALRPFIDDEEDYKRLVAHESDPHYGKGKKIRSLVNASTSGILLLDDELCGFINEFTSVLD